MTAFDRATVVGAGAIGGTVAGFLALAGNRVTVVDRSKLHVEAIRREGLLIDGARGEHRVRFDQVLYPEELEGPLGLVLLAVKSQHTLEALPTITPLLADDGMLVSLQNSLNEPKIAKAVGAQRTIGAVVHMPANMPEPGHVTRSRDGELYVGELDGADTARIRALAEYLSQAVTTHVTANVWGHLWTKLIYNCYMVAAALVDAPTDEVMRLDWCQRILVALLGEAADVATANGVRLEAFGDFDPRRMQVLRASDLPAAFAELPKGSGGAKNQVWQDIRVRHRKSDANWLSGEAMRVAEDIGYPAPITTAVTRMILEIEGGQRETSWENLRALLPLADARLPDTAPGTVGVTV